MREILIISGKGGTGKTSLTAAFASLAEDMVLCDLDVDAPDLHILLQPDVKRTEDFISGHEAIINPELCTNCGTCVDACRFEAIVQEEACMRIEPLRCEGCKVCVVLCPAGAVDFPDRHCGRWYLSETRFGPMVHAQLFPGEENSGRLVSLLKKEARELAEARGLELILSDGAPGVGCPVISSLSGAALAVMVTEPTPSGRHDLARVGELCAHFKIKGAVIVNKYDLNPEETGRIEELCRNNGWDLVARLPHDRVVTEAMVQGKAVTEFGDNGFADLLKPAWKRIVSLAGE